MRLEWIILSGAETQATSTKEASPVTNRFSNNHLWADEKTGEMF